MKEEGIDAAMEVLYPNAPLVHKNEDIRGQVANAIRAYHEKARYKVVTDAPTDTSKPTRTRLIGPWENIV